jgi:putative phosphoribosyl transferase
MIFQDRTDAGRTLAKQLGAYANRTNVIVLGIPRGGVPVAFEVARALNAPLDVFLSRKLGVPGQEELAFGAVATGGVRVLDPEIIEASNISEQQIDQITEKVRMELERRERAYRGGRPPLHFKGQIVILVDDGIATGSSMRAAVSGLKQMKPARIVIAVPVTPLSTCNHLRSEVDEVVCLHTPKFFYAIGEFYEDFSQLNDDEVSDLLCRATQPAVRNAA